jgi:hypothetical protein
VSSTFLQVLLAPPLNSGIDGTNCFVVADVQHERERIRDTSWKSWFGEKLVRSGSSNLSLPCHHFHAYARRHLTIAQKLELVVPSFALIVQVTAREHGAILSKVSASSNSNFLQASQETIESIIWVDVNITSNTQRSAPAASSRYRQPHLTPSVTISDRA